MEHHLIHPWPYCKLERIPITGFQEHGFAFVDLFASSHTKVLNYIIAATRRTTALNLRSASLEYAPAESNEEDDEQGQRIF
jgi:hypothetical protein